MAISETIVLKIIIRILHRLKLKKWITPILILILIFVLGYKVYSDGWRPRVIYQENMAGLLFSKTNLAFSDTGKTADSIAPQKPTIAQLQVDCPDGYLCSDFSDEDFSGWSEYSRSSRNTRLLTVSSDSGFDNPPLLFRKGSTKINFQMTLQAKPMNNAKGNIVILYYQAWRCTIGEANYNTISCSFKYDSENSPPQKPQFLSSQGKKPISPQNDIIIDIKSELTSENKNRIELVLNYIDTDDNKADARFEYIFGLPNPDIQNYEQLVGIGIIDPNNEKVEVEFKSFRLLKT